MPSTNNSQHNRNKVSINPTISLFAFIILTCMLIAPGLLSPEPQKAISIIALFVDIIIFFILAIYLTGSKEALLRKKTLFRIILMIFTFFASLAITAQWDSLIEGISVFVNFLNEYNPLVISTIITLTLGFLLFFAKVAISRIQKWIFGLTNNYFIFTLAGLAILGASSALLIPSYTNWFRSAVPISAQQDTVIEDKEKAQDNPTSSPSLANSKTAEVEQKSTSDLRLHLLYITGGIIAILGLVETNRKNSQDHIRQVHAARRDRYIKAVDKLSSEHAPVRLGGVYALVGLVDEWLDDDNIDEETRIKEGQVIINNLCSYIRSPFPLAEKIEEYEAHKELEKLQESESEKLSIEEHSRLQVLLKRFKDSDEYKKPNDITADYAKFHGEQDVRRAIFEEMSKRSSTFAKDNKGKIIDITSGPWSGFNFDFSRAPIFYPLNGLTIEQGQFSSARFYGDTNFVLVKFTRYASFMRAKFTGIANFGDAEFIIGADFGNTEFTRIADFGSAKFTGNAYFLGAKFAGNAYFWGAKFAGNANFRNAEFIIGANFGNAEFTRIADFGSAKFIRKAYFTDAEFTSNTNFNSAYFEKYVPTFADDIGSARFSSQRDQKDYVFSADQNGKPINCGTATLDGKSLKIPLGAVLFDPDSGRTSGPAKPIEESDNPGKTPSK